MKSSAFALRATIHNLFCPTFSAPRPDWIDKETYESLPDSLTVRELVVCVEQPGFRVDSFVVVTTLTQARQYTSADIAKLYHKRCLAELDIRAIKISLGMDVLRCKSPEMIRREVAACLLAYNLIRQTSCNRLTKQASLRGTRVSRPPCKRSPQASLCWRCWKRGPRRSVTPTASTCLPIESVTALTALP